MRAMTEPVRGKRRGQAQWNWRWRIHVPCPDEFKLRWKALARERGLSEAEIALRVLNAALDDAAYLDAVLHGPAEEVFPRVFNPPSDSGQVVARASG